MVEHKTQIVPVSQVTEKDITVLSTLADKFSKSKALPAQLDNPEKVFMVLMAWRDLWLSTTQSLNWLYIVNGKISVFWETAALLMKRWWYVIERWECNSKLAQVTIWHKDNPENKHTEKFSIEEATHAWIAWSIVWKKYPKVMLRWKALAMARKMFAPDCLWWYSMKEELDGEVINHDEPIIDEADVLDGFNGKEDNKENPEESNEEVLSDNEEKKDG